MQRTEDLKITYKPGKEEKEGSTKVVCPCYFQILIIYNISVEKGRG